jgi:hypothetical protein
MQSFNFIKRIKFYSILSFLVPLIAINSCFALYKFIGSFDTSFDFGLEKEKVQYSYVEYLKITSSENVSFTNCSKFIYKKKFIYKSLFITKDNQSIEDTSKNYDIKKRIIKNNNIASIIFERQKVLNERCIKNNQFVYLLLKNFSSLEKILLKGKIGNSAGFASIENPYLYGEVSISRTARFFPSILIFKTLIILSSILLFLYWKNNLNLFNELKNKNILDKFSNIFFYLGTLSCVFLILHAAFLGLDFDSKIFSKIRRLIIILFIFFEVSAQTFLTRNLYKFKEELKEYIIPLILKTKIIFVSTILVVTSVAFTILAFYDPSTEFKHILEWNYFASLLFYYLLSRLLWMKIAK